MSTSPTGAATGGLGTAAADSDSAREMDGVLVRPISGQIYLIDEEDLEEFSGDGTPSLSGLVSRH